MFFLGVDSGGTKTDFCLINGQGKPVFSYSSGSGHIAQIGTSGLDQLFDDFVKELHKNGISIGDISYTFLGMPGYTESESWDRHIETTLTRIFGSRYTCANDAVPGWAGSLACKPGINLVAGTGSIVFGMDAKKNEARCGGWGHYLGDEASGYWIGKNVLEIFTKQSDGRLEKTLLYTLVKERLGLKKDGDIIDLVYNKWNGGREKIAALSKIAHEAALKNDACALKLIDKTAEEMASMVYAVAEQLSFEGAISVSYSGGVFRMGEIITGALLGQLKAHKLSFSLETPLLSPVLGAALYAALLEGQNITPEFIQNLS